MYACPNPECRKSFAKFKEPGRCPHCGIYAGCRCSSCGYSAPANVFIKNDDRCPECNHRVEIPGAGAKGSGCLAGLMMLALCALLLLAT